MSYNTIAGNGVSEVVEKKSKFLGAAFPCTSEEEARAYLAQVKKEHFDAGHHVFCYRIGHGAQPLVRFSDDGEPSGTGGLPLLEMLAGSQFDLRDVLVVVTRYFGGTLLGTGGLVRCYGRAGKEAVLNAGLVTYTTVVTYEVVVSYELSGKVSYLITHNDGVLEETLYDADVTYRFFAKPAEGAALCAKIVEATADNVLIDVRGEAYRALALSTEAE